MIGLIFLSASLQFNHFKHNDSWFLWETAIEGQNLLFGKFVIEEFPETFVYIKNGHFWVNNHRIRFFGTTIGWKFLSCDDETMEMCVKYMKYVGINAVRIHPLGLWKDLEDSLDSHILERLDFLIFLLRKQNIYYSFYSGVTIVAYTIPGEDVNIKKAKAFFNESIERKIKRFYKLLLLHTNKYTNKKYIDDKYLAFVIISNENSPYKLLDNKRGREYLLNSYKEFRSDFQESKSLNLIDLAEIYPFLNEREFRFYTSIKSFLQAIGLKVPIAFTNNPFSFYTQKLQYEHSDFIGVHSYGSYAHGTKRRIIKNENPLIWKGGIPGEYLPTRTLTVNYRGKPIIIDEWNIGYPVDYRGAGPFLITILSSLYDYDGIFYFNFFENCEYLMNPNKIGNYYWTSLEQPFSPVVIGNFSMFSKIFREFEIEPLKDSLKININDKDILIGNELQYRYNPLVSHYSKLYYMFRVIYEFTELESTLENIKRDFKNLVFQNEPINKGNFFWDYKMGTIYYKSSKFLLFCGNTKSLECGFNVSSDNDFLLLAIYPLDNKDFYCSDSLFIFLGSDAEYFGDFLLPFQFVFGEHAITYHVPSMEDYLLKERTPTVSYIKPSDVSFSIPKKDGIFSLYILDEKLNSSGVVTRFLYAKNGNLFIHINQKEAKSLYYIIVKS